MTARPRVLVHHGTGRQGRLASDAAAAALSAAGYDLGVLPEPVRSPPPGADEREPGAGMHDVAAQVAGSMVRNDAAAVLVADFALLTTLAASPALRGRLWAVTTEFPAPLALVSGTGIPAAAEIASAAAVLLCADETQRGLLDALVPGAARRTVALADLVPPATGATAADTRRLLERLCPLPGDEGAAMAAGRTTPLKVLVAGHALHFLEGVLDRLRADPTLEVRVDHIPSFGRHDEAASIELLDWADAVFCEWCSPVAVWYSRHKRSAQRLVVRLHRYELSKEWPDRLDIDAVDQVVCVSPYYAALTRERTGWPATKIGVIPNYVDTARLARPKIEGAEFRLGMLGVVPQRKRVDLALDVLVTLRRHDPRFSLSVKSKLPWDDPWNRESEQEQSYARAILRRVQSSATLRDAVVWDPHGADVGSWLRRIGFVLSTSDDESFHLAPAEGMASGAVPALLGWPGVTTIYDQRFVHADTDAMAASILKTVQRGRWDEQRHAAQRQARATFDLDVVAAQIRTVLSNDLEACGPGESLAADRRSEDLALSQDI